MNAVAVDWVTVIFGPIGAILLVFALVTARSARKAGVPVPTRAKVLQGLGIACVFLVALLQLFGSN